MSYNQVKLEYLTNSLQIEAWVRKINKERGEDEPQPYQHEIPKQLLEDLFEESLENSLAVLSKAYNANFTPNSTVERLKDQNRFRRYRKLLEGAKSSEIRNLLGADYKAYKKWAEENV